VSVSALNLLKTSAYSWYFSRIEERSIFLKMVVDVAYIVEQNWRENVIKPERHEVWSRASTLIIAI